MFAPGKTSYDQPRQHIRKQKHYSADKGLSNKSCGFSNSHVWMWEVEYKESWALLNCSVEDSWESLGLQGDPSGPSYRKTVLNTQWKDWCWSWNSNIWPSDAKNWLIYKAPAAGNDWRQEEKGKTQDEMVGWH